MTRRRNNRRNRERKKNPLLRLGLLAAAILGLFVAVPIVVSVLKEDRKVTRQSDERSARNEALDQHLQSVLSDPVQKGQRDQYWLTGNESNSQHLSLIEDMEGRIRTLLERHRHFNGLTRKLYDRFKNFYITEYRNGISLRLHRGATTGPDRGSFEICVIPRNQLAWARVRSEVQYDADWRAIQIVAVKMPDAWLAALLYHELGHAYRHIVDQAPSATAPPHTLLYAGEEIEMHDLESRLLNQASSGALYNLYSEIVGRVPDAVDFVDLFLRLRKDDLTRFHTTFSTGSAGPVMTGVYQAQFLLGLASFALERRAGADNLAERKAQMYLALGRAISSTR